MPTRSHKMRVKVWYCLRLCDGNGLMNAKAIYANLVLLN